MKDVFTFWFVETPQPMSEYCQLMGEVSPPIGYAIGGERSLSSPYLRESANAVVGYERGSPAFLYINPLRQRERPQVLPILGTSHARH